MFSRRKFTTTCYKLEKKIKMKKKVYTDLKILVIVKVYKANANSN